MALKSDIPSVLRYIQEKQTYLELNHELFNIYEGDLLSYVLKDLAHQISEDSYEIAAARCAPINILKRVTDKLSGLYMTPPQRSLTIETDRDQALFDYYNSELDMNVSMALANTMFNLFKSVAIEPYVENRKPRLRIIPADRFLFFSNDRTNPTTPTHYIKFMGKYRADDGSMRGFYYFYSTEEFIIFDDRGMVLYKMMDELEIEPVNPIGRIPATYINRSKHLITPLFDYDQLKMTKLIPILLTDLNFAAMFQSFSIVYGIDVDKGNLKMSPNAFWDIKSDATSDKTPQIGMIKPSVDIAATIGLIQSELIFWMNSKGIRPGAVGQLSQDSFASGISKMIDEMDTFENKTQQVPYFESGEKDLWSLIINHMHPYWLSNAMIDLPSNAVFSPGQEVIVKFPEQKPMMKRADLIAQVKLELESGLTTLKRALSQLNPEMTDEEIEALAQEIEEGNQVEVPQMAETNENVSEDSDEEDDQGPETPDVEDATE